MSMKSFIIGVSILLLIIPYAVSAQGIKQRVETLESKVRSLQRDVSAIKGNVGGLHSDVGKLKTAVSSLQSDLAVAKTGIKGLLTDVGDLQNDVSILQGDVEALRAKIEELENNLTTIGDNLATLQGYVSDLQGDVTDHEDRISALEAATLPPLPSLQVYDDNDTQVGELLSPILDLYQQAIVRYNLNGHNISLIVSRNEISGTAGPIWFTETGCSGVPFIQRPASLAGWPFWPVTNVAGPIGVGNGTAIQPARTVYLVRPDGQIQFNVAARSAYHSCDVECRRCDPVLAIIDRAVEASVIGDLPFVPPYQAR